MIHARVFEQFKVYFPQYVDCVRDYFPNGKNSIRIRMTVGEDYIFTFHDPGTWCFETVKHFVVRLKGEKK